MIVYQPDGGKVAPAQLPQDRVSVTIELLSNLDGMIATCIRGLGSSFAGQAGAAEGLQILRGPDLFDSHQCPRLRCRRLRQHRHLDS